MKYQTTTDQPPVILQGDSYREIVEQLRSQSLNPAQGLESFMQATADRCKLQRGSTIRTDSFQNFVDDLEASQFIQKIEDPTIKP